MKIKKFRNGKIKLTVEPKHDIEYKINTKEFDTKISESVYHNDMFFADLYINQINGYQYITNHNTQRVYELGSYLMQNPLKWLLDELAEKRTIYFYPLSRKQSKSLLQDLENGY